MFGRKKKKTEAQIAAFAADIKNAAGTLREEFAAATADPDTGNRYLSYCSMIQQANDQRDQLVSGLAMNKRMYERNIEPLLVAFGPLRDVIAEIYAEKREILQHKIAQLAASPKVMDIVEQEPKLANRLLQHALKNANHEQGNSDTAGQQKNKLTGFTL